MCTCTFIVVHFASYFHSMFISAFLCSGFYSCLSTQAMLSLYGMLEYMLCSEIVLLLNMADILHAGRLVSEQ